MTRTFAVAVVIMVVAGAVLARDVAAQKKPHKKEHAAIPKEELKVLFPAVTSFSARDCKPSKAQQTAIEQQVGLKLTDDDLHNKCVVALHKTPEGKTASVGVAWFTHVEGTKGDLEVGLALDPQGKVLRVAVYEHQESNAIKGQDFLQQFAGKSPDDPFRIGQDLRAAAGDARGSQLAATAFRKAALVIKATFFEKKAATP